jgi:SNF2 family DNA or RNA helicase
VKTKDNEIRVIEHDIAAPNISTKNLTALKKKLSDVKEQRDNITKRQEEMLAADCVICSEPLTDPVIDPKCQNMFCGACMLKWLEIKGTCPMCRARVDPSDLAYVASGDSSSDTGVSVDQPMSRVETLLSIVSGNDDRKIIVYSSRSSTFSTIRGILPKGSFVEISGGVAQRTRAVNRWKTGKIRIIFLNSSTNSSGLNLQMATDIVLYHDMSGDTLKQVLGRPVRIGRTSPLTIHKIVTA